MTPRELAEEFRRLAAGAEAAANELPEGYSEAKIYEAQKDRGKRDAFEQAAQMLEERLNG